MDVEGEGGVVMAHKRGLTASPEWWKHLRPFNKRMVAKAERRASKAEITDEMVRNDLPPARLGLHNDPGKMKVLRESRGPAVVPAGIYCYGAEGNCPYWDKAENAAEQGNGYCWLLGKGDWDQGMDLLWDQCKCCGHREDEAPEGTLEVV